LYCKVTFAGPVNVRFTKTISSERILLFGEFIVTLWLTNAKLKLVHNRKTPMNTNHFTTIKLRMEFINVSREKVY
jgi:hypothetical protein